MKSSSEIRFDFQNAMEQAKKLDSLADNIERRVSNKLEEAAQNIHSAWKGDSATRYIGKTQELQQQTRQTARTLRDTAEDIRRIARRIYEAEMRALEIAQKRDRKSVV